MRESEKRVEPGTVLAVIGTRPEAIKMAPVVAALRRTEGLGTRVVLTGQHIDLVDRVLATFELRPDHDLGIMREGQSLYEVAEGCLAGLREVVRSEGPEMILVQGDTATVFFASLVGFFERVRVGHVEAGLRSGDKWAPYPEEVFRRLTDGVADLHFAPTPRARENLLAEGVAASSVHVTGNTVVDALGTLAGSSTEELPPAVRQSLEAGERLVLVTAHRRESFGEPIRDVFRAIRSLADGHSDVAFLYPVHPNPEVLEPATEILSGHPRIHLTEPLGYFELLRALETAVLVLTDSGGIQEEAPSFGAPVLVLREVTERPEGIAAGVARLVGTDPEAIVREASRLLEDEDARREMMGEGNPYGDGRAGERIADVVASLLLDRPRHTEGWEGPG